MEGVAAKVLEVTKLPQSLMSPVVSISRSMSPNATDPIAKVDSKVIVIVSVEASTPVGVTNCIV